MEDDTLARFITQNSGLTIGGALKRVENFSKDDIWYHLEKFKRFRLDNFGDLIREDNGYIHFEPLAKDSLIYNSFGLESVSLVASGREKKKVSAYWLWLFIPFLLCLTFLSVDYSYKYYQNRVEESYVLSWLSPDNNNQSSGVSSISSKDKEDSSEGADLEKATKTTTEKELLKDEHHESGDLFSTDEKADPVQAASSSTADSRVINAQLNTKAAKQTDFQQTPKARLTAIKGDGTKVYVYAPVDSYTIIVGERSSLREARELSKEMRRQGYAGKVIGKDTKGNYLISILSYSDGNQARKRLASIKNYIARNAYIITR